ncbi:MAG: prepilin-type N-terminal cleavage/methylation domain-containing protein [Opitutales bacterium]|nr:prepilin-type N-terminal cleavage/methylation domain-containing protein [Opitutales bacterium]
MQYRRQPHRRPAKRDGFTLVELMFAIALSALVLTAFHQLVLGTGRSLFDSTNKLLIAKDVRAFTNEISRSGRSARDFRIYTSLDDLTEQQSGYSGDVLALVWAEPESIEEAVPGQAQRFFITHIIIYARAPDPGQTEGPVWRYERTYELPNTAQGIAGTDSKKHPGGVRALVEDILASGERRRVLQLSRGLVDERLFFYSRLGESVVVNGEIYHGNDHRRMTNTYNFTISPRG